MLSAEEEIQLAKEAGFEEGVRGTVRVLQSKGSSKMEAIQEIYNLYEMSGEDATAYVNKYWE